MDWKLLKNKNFSLFIFGQSTSILGDSLLNIALSLYVLKVTGSAGKFASILALGVIPQLILGSFSGTIADRLDKKKAIIFMDVIRGIFLLALFGLLINNEMNITYIYIMVIFFAICSTFFLPCYVTILPQILKSEELVSGNALVNVIMELIRVVGPLLATFMFGLYGLGIILILDAFTFFASAVCTLLMKFKSIRKKSEASKFYTEVKDGFLIFFKDIRITSLVGNGILTHLFLFPFILIGIPYMLINIFAVPDINYGIVLSISPISLILSGLIVPYTKKKFNTAQSITIGIIGMLLSVVCFILLGNSIFVNLLKSNNILTTIYFGFAYFLMYFSFGYYAVFYVSFYQTNIPLEYLGRYSAVQIMLFSIARLIGFKLMGYLFNQGILIYSILVLGIGMLLKLVVHVPFIKREKQLLQNQVLLLNTIK